MTDNSATTLTGVNGGRLTDDGYYGLIRFTTEGDPLVVALPSESLMTLGLLALSMAPASPPPTLGQAALAQALDTKWWTVSKAADGSLVLTFELQTGGQIGFRLAPQDLTPFQEALAVASGATAPTPDRTH